LHVIFLTVFIKFVVSITIVNDNPSVTIVTDDPSLTIVNIIVNIVFSKAFVFKKQLYKKRSQIVFKKRLFSKTIAKRFLKVQNEWVVFKNDRYFPKKKRSFFKTIKKRNKKRLTTLPALNWCWLSYCANCNYKCSYLMHLI